MRQKRHNGAATCAAAWLVVVGMAGAFAPGAWGDDAPTSATYASCDGVSIATSGSWAVTITTGSLDYEIGGPAGWEDPPDPVVMGTLNEWTTATIEIDVDLSSGSLMVIDMPWVVWGGTATYEWACLIHDSPGIDYSVYKNYHFGCYLRVAPGKYYVEFGLKGTGWGSQRSDVPFTISDYYGDEEDPPPCPAIPYVNWHQVWATVTPTPTATVTTTPTPSPTPIATVTLTPSPTPMVTRTPTPSPTPIATATATAHPTATATASVTATATARPTATQTVTVSPTATVTVTASCAPAVTGLPLAAVLRIDATRPDALAPLMVDARLPGHAILCAALATVTVTATPTPYPTVTVTATPTPYPTVTVTATPTPYPTVTVTVTPVETVTVSPHPTVTAIVTATVSPVVTAVATATVYPMATPVCNPPPPNGDPGVCDCSTTGTWFVEPFATVIASLPTPTEVPGSQINYVTYAIFMDAPFGLCSENGFSISPAQYYFGFQVWPTWRPEHVWAGGDLRAGFTPPADGAEVAFTLYRLSFVDDSFTTIAQTSVIPEYDCPCPALVQSTPAWVEFGEIGTSASLERTVSVYNAGCSMLEGTATARAPFSVPRGGTLSVAPATTHSVVVRFEPSGRQTGRWTDVLRLDTNDSSALDVVNLRASREPWRLRAWDVYSDRSAWIRDARPAQILTSEGEATSVALELRRALDVAGPARAGRFVETGLPKRGFYEDRWWIEDDPEIEPETALADVWTSPVISGRAFVRSATAATTPAAAVIYASGTVGGAAWTTSTATTTTSSAQGRVIAGFYSLPVPAGWSGWLWAEGATSETVCASAPWWIERICADRECGFELTGASAGAWGNAALHAGLTVSDIRAGVTTPTLADVGYTTPTITELSAGEAYRLYYSDGDGVMTGLALSDEWDILVSGGAAAAPKWEDPDSLAEGVYTYFSTNYSNMDFDSTDDFDGLVSSLTGDTDDLDEGTSNVYFLAERAVAALLAEYENLDTDSTDDFDGNITSLSGTVADLETVTGLDIITSGENNDSADDVSLTDVQAALSNDFHNVGGTDDDVPDAGDFGAATDLDANGNVGDDSHYHHAATIPDFRDGVSSATGILYPNLDTDSTDDFSGLWEDLDIPTTPTFGVDYADMARDLTSTPTLGAVWATYAGGVAWGGVDDKPTTWTGGADWATAAGTVAWTAITGLPTTFQPPDPIVPADGEQDVWGSLNLLDATDPQLTLSQAAGSKYAKLKVDSNGYLYVTSNRTDYHLLGVGENDTVRGWLQIYGDSASVSDGGKINLFTSADYDSSIGNYQVGVYQDDFQIGPISDTDSLQYNGGSGQWEFNNANGVYVVGDLSANDLVDRCNWQERTTTATLAAVLGIGGAKGRLNHATLPDAVRRDITRRVRTPADKPVAALEEGEQLLSETIEVETRLNDDGTTAAIPMRVRQIRSSGRSLGDAITLNTQAIQALIARSEAQEARIGALEESLSQLWLLVWALLGALGLTAVWNPALRKWVVVRKAEEEPGR